MTSDERPRPHTLVVRLDSMGDVLLTGPAVRAVAHGSRRVTFLAGPRGREAAGLLPGADEVLTWSCPWIDATPAPVDGRSVAALVAAVRDRRPDRAVVLTSFHQSALPTALLLRLAGVPWVGAVSEDYPGSLLDLRLGDPGDVHEAERSLRLVRAAGYDLPPGDDGRLHVCDAAAVAVGAAATGARTAAARTAAARTAAARTGTAGAVVLHPGTSAPARAWPPARWAELCRALCTQGGHVVVTGGAGERSLAAEVVAGTPATDLSGRTGLAELAGVLRQAAAVVAANTGTAHLAAAVGTPVVSLFAPTVPWERWRPYRVPTLRLGDQHAPCRGTRATRCPVPGHPCLATVRAEDVAAAVDELVTVTHTPDPVLDTGGVR